MKKSEIDENPRFRLGLRDTLRILAPYVQRNFRKQVDGIWFIVTYLIVFQWLILKLPLVFSLMIACGIFIVAVGLTFFMEGLRLGLMPLGETIGSVLPRNSQMTVILLVAFLLGAGATFAEPAIAVLKAAGSGVKMAQAPLLHSLLNEYSGQLVGSVGVGVGIAVMLGVLRFFYAWPLKFLAIPTISSLLLLSFYFNQVPELRDVLGLAWDCGAVTTGPVTVPLVLALGIGVCRVVSSNGGNSGHSGFGIVTLASLFPILAVLILALFHFSQGHYYGGKNFTANADQLDVSTEAMPTLREVKALEDAITDEEFQRYLDHGELPEGYHVDYQGGQAALVNGRIVVKEPSLIIKKIYAREFTFLSEQTWDTAQSIRQALIDALIGAVRAIIPLCLFLYFVLRFVLKQRLEHGVDVTVGIGFALAGMTLFSLGIAFGLTPLGGQLGSNIPLTFAEIVPWGLAHHEGPLFGTGHSGKLVAVGFAFFLGYGATLAEPALNALGDTVERITVGAFPKRLLMQSVAIGVGIGIGAGIIKMAYNLPLFWMVMPPYLLVIFLTWKAPHNFVNFAWDSAGVTTGPITVPLVLAMGLGVGANVPGVSDGFGILALASVGPILTVLSVGLYTQSKEKAIRDVSRQDNLSETSIEVSG